MMELSDYRRGLFQWDTGRSLIVTEKDITEVHFQLLPPPSGSTETTDVPVSAGIAKIPDELLQSGLPIRAYAWGDGYSHYDQTFCVTKREKPTGYASDPADAITLESVQAKLQAEIDGKIQMPDVGDAGDVLKKTESGVEWGQAAGQSDWAENDYTAPGYVKNRPFYTGDPVETVLVEESTVSFTDGGGRLYMAESPPTFEATVGEIYNVRWDGTVYECTCVDFNGKPVIGNLSILGAGSDTGEPFIMVLDGWLTQILTADTSASHTFFISGIIPEVIKIDRKYLPKAAFITYDLNTNTYSSDLTNYELYKIMLDGGQVVFYNQPENSYYYLTKWVKKSSGEIYLTFGVRSFRLSLLTNGTIEAAPLE